MPTVVVDGIDVELDPQERLNGIQVARRVGVEIPHYCWHPGLSVVASCRMCLVESGRRDPATGQITMVPKLVPACQTPATDGTVFVTQSDKVKAARAMVEEDLLLRHPVDCPICDKAGECSLQDYHFQHGHEERRADIQPFHSRRRPLGETVTLFVDRCVMCTRCVRFTREISGGKELMVTHRGSHEEIDVFPGYPLSNKLAGNVVDLCPVGALGDIDFLYSQRVWFMRKHDSVCGGCSTGCSISIEENQDHVYRLKPRENPHVNHWWMCDEGRYGYHHIHAPSRVIEVRAAPEAGTARDRAALNVGADGRIPLESTQLTERIERALRAAQGIALVVSPFVTVEEAFLLASYVRSVDPQARLALGPVPRQGEDEVYPQGFTILAEKCPNRRGVEQVLSRFTDGFLAWEDLVKELRRGSYDTLWITGGYRGSEDATPADMRGGSGDRHLPSPPGTDPAASGTYLSLPPTDGLEAGLSTLITQDLFASPWWDVATIQVPGVSFAERAGSYVNAGDRLQSFDWAIRPPAGAVSEGQLAWRLLRRSGMYRPRDVLLELARHNPYFEAVCDGVPPQGVDLKATRMAEV